MDKYFKIQKLVEMQKERKERIEKIFVEIFGFLPKFELAFQSTEKISYKNITDEEKIFFNVKMKVRDKSSVKFAVVANKQKIVDVYRQSFVGDSLIIS